MTMAVFWMGVAAPFALAAVLATLYFVGTCLADWWKDWRPSIERDTDRFRRAHVASAFMLARVFFFVGLPGGYMVICRSRVRGPKGDDEHRFQMSIKDALRAYDRAKTEAGDDDE